jgi:hypothetical protein
MNQTTDNSSELGRAVADVRRIPLRRLALTVETAEEPCGTSPGQAMRRGTVPVFQSSI